MNPDLTSETRAVVDSVCALGCDRVYQIIDALEAGEDVEETAGLSRSQQRQVLEELRAIMSVYTTDAG
jgi:predicted GTPase